MTGARPSARTGVAAGISMAAAGLRQRLGAFQGTISLSRLYVSGGVAGQPDRRGQTTKTAAVSRSAWVCAVSKPCWNEITQIRAREAAHAGDARRMVIIGQGGPSVFKPRGRRTRGPATRFPQRHMEKGTTLSPALAGPLGTTVHRDATSGLQADGVLENAPATSGVMASQARRRCGPAMGCQLCETECGGADRMRDAAWARAARSGDCAPGSRPAMLIGLRFRGSGQEPRAGLSGMAGPVEKSRSAPATATIKGHAAEMMATLRY